MISHMLNMSKSHPLLIREDVGNSDDIRDQCTLTCNMLYAKPVKICLAEFIEFYKNIYACFCLHLDSCIRLNVFRLPASPAVAPDTINNHVKTCYEEQRNLHFYAPEYGGKLVFMHLCLCVCAAICSHLTSECTRLWRFSPCSLVVF